MSLICGNGLKLQPPSSSGNSYSETYSSSIKSHQIAFSSKAAEASPTSSFPHKTILKAHYFLSFDAILCDYHLACCLLTGNTVKKKLTHSINSLNSWSGRHGQHYPVLVIKYCSAPNSANYLHLNTIFKLTLWR